MTIRTAVAILVLLAVCGEPTLAAEKPHIVFLIGELEYQTRRTLPAFAKDVFVRELGFRCTFVHADTKNKNRFPGIEAIKEADLVVLSVRRRALPVGQLALVKKYLAAGRPLVGIRTANHAFHTRGKHPEGHAEWQEFDRLVLGGHYVGHHGNKLATRVGVIPEAKDHPILAGITRQTFAVGGSLYKVNPLKKTCVPLLLGRVDGAAAEPVAWTHTYSGGRIFYTSLGHPKDFSLPDFRRLLRNAVLWGLKRKTTG